ncbi:hypothetical protein P168DRAFT_163823 [Aspergillus campestris IBT 28561]|uniref:F-box domain-containing protein n=1 Tax=Aspergillus campestris (strain IBT 28561) TaxID=1392248 RepID=A0A2I1D0Y1_ASPC2|nr:uncharacterized protein P168DRAFT_163823 [Aspergillus campestris IBT 28561]PKY03508.1 hypothetical protein P168DRAFT_163823 [Aspergillus campestris IBT 28561]
MSYEEMDRITDDDTDKGCIRDSLSSLASALDSVRFPDDHLRRFRWEVGTCIPEVLFCGPNSLLGNQGQIQSIKLITDGECGANKSAQNSVNHVQFRDLQSLDWRGLNQFDDFESVRQCIKAHGHQIKSLTLDLLTWIRAEKIWADGFCQRMPQPIKTPDNFFSQSVLDIYPRDQKIIFLALEDLHLSAVSFYHTGMEMVHAFHIERLKSLRLRNCPGSLGWLRMILNSGKSTKLKTLELAFDLNSLERDTYMHITETICDFVHDFSSLESVYLMLPEPVNWGRLIHTLSGHRHLKRLVVHHLVDRGGQNLIDGDIPWPSHLDHTLQESQLTCFGASIPPMEAVVYKGFSQDRHAN